MKLRYLAVFYGCLGLAAAEPVGAQTLSTFGTPGLIDMPTAEVLEDAEVALTTNYFGNNTRNTVTFQVLPRVYGSFRYSVIRDFDDGGARDRFDRSFDVHFQIAYETQQFPALAVGLRDFGGTGVYSGEYFVATKSFGDRFKVTGGMGWGRLAQRGEFRNPLSYISDSFRERPASDGLAGTGQVDFGSWFRGPAAIFGGIEYQATDRLSFQLEYSTDAYDDEVSRGVIDIESPFNVGLNYTFSSGSNLRAFVIGGREIGLQYSYVFNPKNPRAPGGFDKAPLPIGNRSEATLADMQLSDRKSLTRARQLMQERLEEEGMTLEGFVVDGPRATIRIENTLWGIEAQAIGRAARVMANTLPSNIDTFIITTQEFGVPNSTITLQRDDLRELQTDVDGAWRSLSRSQIEDADPDTREGEIDGLYPKFFYGFGPFTRFSFFDPDEPLRFDFGAQLAMSYRPNPGLSFDMLLRQPVIGNIDEATRRSDSVLPRVRSDAALYAIESDLEINRLTAEYMFKPRENVFGRVSAGYLEAMYAGVSGELLWYPIDSPLALGVEINYVRQRDFDMLFGLQDYDVVTGHASAYYDFRNGFVAQVDAGRYLAGDWGATLGIDREFNNGFKIGGYFTLTDVSFEDFGEGSFDKGIRMTIPLSWLTGKPSRENYGRTIQPVTRDGGARLFVANRLYGVTRDNRAIGLNNGWGRFYR